VSVGSSLRSGSSSSTAGSTTAMAFVSADGGKILVGILRRTVEESKLSISV